MFPEWMEELTGCMFARSVEASALAVITPVLLLGLNTPSETAKRYCCFIVDNM